MTRRISTALVLVALLGAVPAAAQNMYSLVQQERLRGLTEVELLIEDLTDDSASCGVTEALLRSVASKVLLDNGIRIIPSGETTLYVNVHTIYLEPLQRLCVSYVQVELHQFLRTTPAHSEQPVFGEFVLERVTSIQSSGAVDQGQRMRDVVFNAAEEIAVDIRVANQ